MSNITPEQYKMTSEELNSGVAGQNAYNNRIASLRASNNTGPTVPITSNINNTNANGLSLPNGSIPSVGTEGVNGMVDYYKSLFDTETKKQADLQAQEANAKQQQTEQTQSWVDKIKSAISPSQTQTNATTETGINPTNYFAEEKASIAELDSLQSDYNNAVANRDKQIAGVYGNSNQALDFQSNQIAQINRNSAIVLNQMSSNINSKAATLQAKQNMFTEAQNYIDKAITASTAEQKYNMDMYQSFYDMNQKIIDSLDAQLQDSYKTSMTAAQNAWQTAVDEKNKVGDLQLQYPNAGINVSTDSLENAIQKASQSVSSSGNLTSEIVGGFEVLKDQSGKVISTKSLSTGDNGLTPAQINSSINSIASSFDNEPIVKNYNTAQEGYQTLQSIGVDTKNPADDIAFIYSFAKIMDPNSVVREGEYNTIQKYAQTWADNFGFKATRIFSNTNFLSPDAKQKMLNALKPKVETITKQYESLQNEYQRQIDDVSSGGTRQITDYGKAFDNTSSSSDSKNATNEEADKILNEISGNSNGITTTDNKSWWSSILNFFK
jgi:hypothetical protein